MLYTSSEEVNSKIEFCIMHEKSPKLIVLDVNDSGATIKGGLQFLGSTNS